MHPTYLLTYYLSKDRINNSRGVLVMKYAVKATTKNFKLLNEDELIKDLLEARGVEDVQAFFKC